MYMHTHCCTVKNMYFVSRMNRKASYYTNSTNGLFVVYFEPAARLARRVTLEGPQPQAPGVVRVHGGDPVDTARTPGHLHRRF